jgi:hypothetical protein
MFVKGKVLGCATALLLSSTFGSAAGAQSIPAGTTVPTGRAGHATRLETMASSWALQGNQIDTCQKYSVGDNGSGKAFTWNDIAHPTNGGRQPLYVSKCKNVIYALRTIPESHNAYSSSCKTYVATGTQRSFDAYYRTMAQELATHAPDFLIIRVGWELNHDFPWSIARCDTAEEVNGYKNTHRKSSTCSATLFPGWARNSSCPGVFVRDSAALSRPLSELYPGDSYVDTIAVDYYDRKFNNWGLNNSTDAKFKEMASQERPSSLSAFTGGMTLRCP